EAGETAEQCVARGGWEETSLRVAVTRLLFEVPDIPAGSYDRLRTYLCVVQEGTARPGIEPEVDGEGQPTIQDIGWFHLRRPETWDGLLREEEITYHMLQQVRAALGYLPKLSSGVTWPLSRHDARCGPLTTVSPVVCTHRCRTGDIAGF